jgi:Fe-S-cluster containining protein
MEKVAEIYDWLDKQIASNKNLLNGCKACGQCCDFEKFDHLLFVTTPELIFLRQKLNAKDLKKMSSAVCPYNENGKCSVYPHRFAGCRIFFCKTNSICQSLLSETVLRQLKGICEEFNIPYYYCDLKTALNETIHQLD